ncbi:hypothetical protein [Ralstonia sp. UBA689]|nr:hypothetical protein [Ralstonia sp. UBA689]
MTVLMKADNHGQGRLPALLAWFVCGRRGVLRSVFVAGFGTTMLYGNGRR